MRKSTRKRLIRSSLLAVNVLILIAVVVFVLHNPQSRSGATQLKPANQQSNLVINPLDQLSSADIAVNVARMANLPESTAVTNQADSQDAQLAIAQVSDSLVSKPQVVQTAYKSNKDIKVYVAMAGDSVPTIAAKFNVTSDSIRWSNSLTGDTVLKGQKLYIPPVDGIVYVVKAGDTPGSLAKTYSASESKIIAFNDAEIGGLKPGERIIIPGGQPQQTATVASGYGSGGGGYGQSFPWGSGPIYGYNGYDYGYCTWYVASQISVPTNWGNASSWAYYGQVSGWTVSSTPVVGAIAQTPYAAGGEGHVAIVTAVRGGQIKIKDMNGIAGFARVGYSGWISASQFPNYIYH